MPKSPIRTFKIPQNAIEWLLHGERGASSNSIFFAITGVPVGQYKMHPSDPSDFYRCYKLIKQVPEFKPQLFKVATFSKQWLAVYNNWAKMEMMLEADLKAGKEKSPELYKFMKEIGL